MFVKQMTLVFVLYHTPFYIKTLHDLPIKSYQKQKTSHVKMLSKRTQKLSYEEVVKLIQKENIWINSFGLMLLQQMHNIQRECIIKIVSYVVVVVNLIVRHIISRHIFLHSNLIALLSFQQPTTFITNGEYSTRC